MSDLAASAVTPVREWTAGGVNGKDHVEGLYTLVLTGQGDGTDKILATALGFTKIESCGNAIADDDTLVIPASPSYDGTYIVLADPTDGTPNAVTDTVRIRVAGYR